MTHNSDVKISYSPEQLSKYDKLKFSENWNFKLNCKTSFTTLRLSNRYVIGQKLQVIFKKKFMFLATIKDKKSFNLYKINDFIAYLDTGYDAEKTITIIETMYKKYNINWDKKLINLYLLVKE